MPSELTYLRVHNFRRVRPGTFIAFEPQLNTVVGRNGTGKTTLLALISAIVRNNVHEFIHEDFEIGFGLVDGDLSFEGVCRNQCSTRPGNGGSELLLSGILRHGELTIRINGDAHEAQLTYQGREQLTRSVGPERDPQRHAFELIHNLRLNLPDDDPTLRALKMPGPEGVAGDVLRSKSFTSTRIHEGVETFDELFAQDTDHRDRSPTLGVTLATHPELGKIDTKAVANGHHLTDETLLPQLDKQTSIIDTLTLDGSAPPLAQFIELSQYTDARLILTKTSATTKDGGTRLVFAKPVVRFTTTSGDELVHPQLSFGEKRLLAFLIKLHANRHTIIVDELANGMHHSWLERAVELLEDFGTQAFLTSQNPLLLDCLPLDRETYGRAHGLVVCELSSSGEMIWRNLDEAEREDLLRSLDVGLQQLSAAMRTKGLW